MVKIRHPVSLHNVMSQTALKMGIPNKESPLTEAGEQQRDITAQYLKDQFKFDAVYASEYSRTHAIPLAMGEGFEPQIYSHLNERDMGIWHTMPNSAIEEQYPEEVEKKKSTNYYDLHPLNGESCPMVEHRQIEWLSNESIHQGTDCVLISGHGISGLCLRRLLTGESVKAWHWWRKKATRQRLRYASVTVYERHGAVYKCILYNHIPWKGLIDPKLLVRIEKEA